MSFPPVPPRSWVRFCVEASAAPAPTTLVERFRVEAVHTRRGAPLVGVAPGESFVRLESMVELPQGGGDLVGVTQHLGYMRARERPALFPTATPGTDAVCVVISLTKSDAWWQLALDERDALFRGAGREGHVAAGLPHARSIVQKLYHGRPVAGAGWDFVTYFEFEPAARGVFEGLLAGMRDAARNPEWDYVERETELWLVRH